MKLSFQVIGIPKFVIMAKLLDQRVRDEIKTGMFRATLIVVDRAKQNLAGHHSPNPYKHWITGNLSRGTQSKVGWVDRFTIEGVIGTDVPYAGKIEALPDGGYLYPALLSNDKKVRREFEKSVKEAIEKTRTIL